LGFTCLKIFVLWVAEALSRYSYKVGGCKEWGRSIEGDSDTNGGGEKD
jgi:hypothetical protein